MGFDLYGENPKVVKSFSGKKSKRYEELCAMSYENRDKKGLNDEYWKLNDEWESNNPGNYFRNNVWWWRPLWEFTCEHCEDILTEEDVTGGCFNDSHVIPEDKALAIAERLKEALETPETKEYLVRHENAREKAKKENEKLDEQKEALNKIAITMTGDKDIVPMNYPKKLKKQFDELLEERNWASSYPINRENIERFAEFAEQSGGFSIC
jgi:hypothetical protein